VISKDIEVRSMIEIKGKYRTENVEVIHCKENTYLHKKAEKMDV